MVISTSGYYSTGSSAAFVLLKEYSNCTEGILKNWDLKSHDYENILLYTPNSIFDLEDKLLFGNSIHRSDEALKNFYYSMKRLNDNKYIWCGDYQRLFGNEFMQNVNDFINSLTKYQVPGHWEYHYGNDKFNIRKLLGSIRRKILGRPIVGDFSKWLTLRDHEDVVYAFPTREEYYHAAKNFIDKYCTMMKGQSQSKEKLILNHFILPHNLYRLSNYFGEDDIRVIVVDRDPRDVFIMEKYRTRTDHSLLPCDDVKKFVSFWKDLRNSEKHVDDKRIVRIQFEDLIYRYEETVKYIEERCNLYPENHVYQKNYFSPEKSIYNTQLFKLDDKWNDEIKYIEKELGAYLYPFPEDINIRDVITADKLGIYVC